MTSEWRPGTLLGQLSAAERTELLGLGATREYPTGAVLMRQGASARETLLLLRGYVKITASSEHHTVLLTVRAQGDLVGDFAATSGRERSATVTACTPIVAQFLLPDTLRGFLGRHPHAAELVSGLMVEQLSNANRRRVEYATLPVVSRLARVITELVEICGERRPAGGMQLPSWFGQAELADLVGASVDSVQRALRALRRQGVIDTGYRSVAILDPDALDAARGLPDGYWNGRL